MTNSSANQAATQTGIQTSPRIDYIDGIRGWAALSVLLFHVFSEMFGTMFPVFRLPFAITFLDGRLAVYGFFLLSGDALSASFLRNGSYDALARMVAKRYFRLAVPTLVSCALVYLVIVTSLDFHHEAAPILNNMNWLGRMLEFPTSLITMLRYGLSWVFFFPDPAVSYNPFLWSMSIEFFGSAMIFAYLIAVPRLFNPLKITMTVFVVLTMLNSVYSLFFAGMAFGMMRNLGLFDKGRNWLVSSVILLALVLGEFACETLHINKPSVVDLFLAELTLFAIYANPFCVRFFSNALSSYLGKISFPVYLVHFPVLISLTSYCTIWLHNQGMLNATNAMLTGLLSTVSVIALAHVLSKAERMYLVKLNRYAERLLKPRAD